jgi:hypothetical protein
MAVIQVGLVGRLNTAMFGVGILPPSLVLQNNILKQ